MPSRDYRPRPDPTPALSDWAPVISCAPVSRALLAGLADHARGDRRQLAGLPLDGAAGSETATAWHRLQFAAGQLRELDAAVQAAQWQAPVLPEHRQLLDAIPVNATPVVHVMHMTYTTVSPISGTGTHASARRAEVAVKY